MVEKDNVYNEEEIVTEIEASDDTVELDVEEELFKNKLSALREKLKACEEQKRIHSDELQRVRADFLNSKRRLEEQLERDKERAKDKILTEILTLFDGFDTAMTDKTVWESVDVKWRTGVEALHTKLLAILQSNNVIAIDPQNIPFNPEEHEAVLNQEVTDNTQEQMVLTVLQKGFKRGNTIIRPARVVVGIK